MGGWSILHQRSLPRPLSFRMISGTITYKVVLTCPHHLSLGFLVITPHPSSLLSIHHPFRNPIRLGMMTQPLTISVFLLYQCSHLLIFHIIIPPPIVPPFKSSSVLEPINTSTSSSPQNEPDPSSTRVLPPDLHSHHPTQVLPPPLCPKQSPPPIIPPFYASKDETGHPSTSNSNPSSTHTPTTVDHSYYYYRNHQPEIRSFHPPSGVVRSMNSFASTHSRATSSNSILPSKVRSAAVIYQTTPPTTMSPFCTPGVVDPSTYSEASSLTSSHQTTGMSSAVNFTSDSKSSSLQTSNDQHRITTNDSNLSSSDMRGIMNGKPPDMLFLPNDFLPAKKKLIDERHGYKIWTYAVHFDRSLPDKNPDGVQMQSFLNKIMHFYEDIYDNLTKCLLSHLMVG